MNDSRLLDAMCLIKAMNHIAGAKRSLVAMQKETRYQATIKQMGFALNSLCLDVEKLANDLNENDILSLAYMFVYPFNGKSKSGAVKAIKKAMKDLLPK